MELSWIEVLCNAVQQFAAPLIEACQAIDNYIQNVVDSPEAQKLLSEILKATLFGFIEDGSYIGHDDLPPRQYGERLSWGGHRRPYKSKKYPYIARFQRNLPYQRRSW